MFNKSAFTDAEAQKAAEQTMEAADERWLRSRGRYAPSLRDPVEVGPPAMEVMADPVTGIEVVTTPGPNPTEVERLTRSRTEDP